MFNLCNVVFNIFIIVYNIGVVMYICIYSIKEIEVDWNYLEIIINYFNNIFLFIK